MTGAALPGPGIDLEVCLGVGQSESTGVWDAGRWDVDTWGQTDTDLGDWVDISCYVTDDDGVTFGAGASNADGVVTRWEAATTAFTLLGAIFDPGGDVWVGLLGPGLPVRVRWRPTGSPDWLVTFRGFVDDGGFSYDPRTRRARVAATDSTRIFAAFDGLEQPPAGAGETAAARVARIADLVGWPADQRDITPGGVPVQAATLAGNAWTMLLATADTDLAILWLNRAGDLAYRPQGKVIPDRDVLATVGCEPGQIMPITIAGQQPTVTRNVVSIARAGGAAVTVRDDPSIARFLPHTYQRTDLIHTDDAWSQIVAEAVLVSSAWPTAAPEVVHLDSRADRAASALLLALEPSLSIAVDDGAAVWQCEPAGWSVVVHRDRVEGEIRLLDVTAWFGDAWDAATWDNSRWGF